MEAIDAIGVFAEMAFEELTPISPDWFRCCCCGTWIVERSASATCCEWLATGGAGVVGNETCWKVKAAALARLRRAANSATRAAVSW